MKYVWILIFPVILSFSLKAQNCENLQGKWINQSESLLIIDSIGSSGMLYGNYASSTGVDGISFPLTGWVNFNIENNKPLIGFTVAWGEHHSLTSWAGYCQQTEDGPTIHTIWHYVNTTTEYDWKYFNTNVSVFRPLKD